MDRKKFIILCSSIIGAVVLITIVFLLINTFVPQYVTYEQAEIRIAKATQKYYQENPNQLPTIEGKSTLSYGTLVTGNYIKPLNELLKDGDSCMVDIFVLKNGESYNYQAYLNCGKNYTTKELYKVIINDNPIVTSESGLYKDENNEYYFRGKINNNYVLFGKNTFENEEYTSGLWRIISIKDNIIKLRSVKPTNKRYAWDTSYNNVTHKNTGYNDFEKSIIKDTLKELENENEFMTLEDQAKLVSKNLCIGERSTTDKSKNGNSECSIQTKDKYIFGLLNPYEYLRASIDPNCSNINDRNCTNHNYLSTQEDSSWTLIKNPANNYELFTSNGYSYYLQNANQREPLYLTINLNEFVLYKQGTGTITDPYIIR